MGLFSRLKDNLNHGGVKIQIQAPSSVPGNQVIPVTVNITSDSSQTIDRVKAEIKAVAREQGLNFGGGGGVQASTTSAQTVAQVENREAFTISPGETKTVNLELFINGGAAGGNNGQLGSMGGALQALASVAQNFGHVNYTYSVHASADVQGITIDPSAKQPIQILPPTENVPVQPAPISVIQSQAPVTPPTIPPVPPVTPPTIPTVPPATGGSSFNQPQ